MKLYIMSNGETRPSNPASYKERNAMKQEAKRLESTLKYYTKYMDKDELQAVWLQHPTVIEYRRLLWNIWAWKDDTQIVREVIACDSCHVYDVPLFKVVRTRIETGQQHEYLICERCRDIELCVYHCPSYTPYLRVYEGTHYTLDIQPT